MKSVTEWSTQFDLYWNNIASDKAPGLDEYEKSVFLTDAQNSIVIALYKGQLGKGFEATEEMRAYLETLIKQDEKTPVVTPSTVPVPSWCYRISSESYIFKTPVDVLFRTWEACTTSCGDIPVIPTTQDDYWRIKSNPFRGPSKRRALRLDYASASASGSDELSVEGYTEIISKMNITKYKVRYLAYPEPIILEDLTARGLKIRGCSKPQTCKLPESIHSLILAEAVRLAKAAWNI